MRHLDTNIVIAHSNAVAHVEEQVKRHWPDLAISTIVLGELLYGVHNSKRVKENLNELNTFLSLVHVVPFDTASAEVFGRLRANLRRLGKEAPVFDLLIAATALSHDATLVTDNTADFQNIPGLKLENWLR